MVDKEIRKAFKDIRKTVSEKERYILRADKKNDAKRDSYKHKVEQLKKRLGR